MFDYMPEQASSWAQRVDWINNFITNISVVCIVVITAVMIYFAIRYRRRSPDQKTAYITHNTTLETVWTVIPTVIVMYVFYYGFVVYKEMREPPANALEITVAAQKWSWAFTYPNGKVTNTELVVPLDQPVRLVMKSKDVTHSLFIPVMRVKEDVLANMYSHLWFHPIKTGEFPIFCTEYCGDFHSQMLATLKVVSPEAFQKFLYLDAPELTPEALGAKLYTSKTCNLCHSLDGVAGIGPSFKGITTSGVREFADGTSAEANENYIRESILNPTAKVVKGFAPAMPSFSGQISDEELAAIIAYLKTL